MSGFSEEGVQAKLSSLNETQDSIVTVAAWISFHKRNAHRSAEIWLSRLKESGAKRLNLIYLANEIVQQAKLKRKDELVAAFSPLITEGTLHAYRSATTEVQNKLRRVVEVWRSRAIFNTEILDAIDSKIEELDRNRSGKRSTLGGSLFSASGPGGAAGAPELQGIVKAQAGLTKANATAATAVPSAEAEYTKLTSPDTAVPTPPVYAARLSALLKSLSAASTSLTSTLEARRSLISSLETLLSSTRASLEKEEGQLATVDERKDGIEAKKREVEDGIMRGLSAENSPLTPAGAHTTATNGGRPVSTPLAHDDDDDDGRPDVEALTPPPTTTDDYEPQTTAEPISHSVTPVPQQHAYVPFQAPPPPGADLLSSLVPGLASHPGMISSPSKKRKLEDEGTAGWNGGGGDAMADLDEDVAELLRQESGGR